MSLKAGSELREHIHFPWPLGPRAVLLIQVSWCIIGIRGDCQLGAPQGGSQPSQLWASCDSCPLYRGIPMLASLPPDAGTRAALLRTGEFNVQFCQK